MQAFKTFIFAVLAAVIGALVGGFVGFFLVIALGTAAGDTGFEGALAMGAATTGLPLGGLIGALWGAVWVIRARSGAAPLMGPRGWSITGLVLMALVVAWAVRVWSITIPEFGTPRPELLVEVKMPVELADESYIKKLWPTYHRADTYVYPYNEINRKEEDGYAIARLRYVMVYRVPERFLAVQYERDQYAVFPLDIGKVPEISDWSDWKKPTAFRSKPHDPESVIDGAPDIEVRTKVRWDGR